MKRKRTGFYLSLNQKFKINSKKVFRGFKNFEYEFK